MSGSSFRDRRALQLGQVHGLHRISVKRTTERVLLPFSLAQRHAQTRSGRLHKAGICTALSDLANCRMVSALRHRCARDVSRAVRDQNELMNCTHDEMRIASPHYSFAGCWRHSDAQGVKALDAGATAEGLCAWNTRALLRREPAG
jgi:hypothetical protein